MFSDELLGALAEASKPRAPRAPKKPRAPTKPRAAAEPEFEVMGDVNFTKDSSGDWWWDPEGWDGATFYMGPFDTRKDAYENAQVVDRDFATERKPRPRHDR